MVILLKKHLFLILCLTLSFSLPIIRYQSLFLEKSDIEEYAQKYANSQYIMGDAASIEITDAELYTYAGYAYVKGENPTTINFEHPPLIKYLYGLSFFVFGNTHIMSLLFYALFLVSFYFFSSLIIKNKNILGIAVLLLASQPLVHSLATESLLDLPLNTLILTLFFIVFSQMQKLRIKYALIGLCLGLLSSVKYPLPFMIVPTLLVVGISYLKNELRYLVLPAVITPLVYLSQYWVYFLNGHSLIDFVLFEKYRLAWWLGDRSMPKFLIFQNLFTGTYKSWWGTNEVMKSEHWSPVLPALFVGYLAAAACIKKNLITITVLIYSLAVLMLYGVGSATYLRYLTQLLPFWIVVILSAFELQFLRKELQ